MAICRGCMSRKEKDGVMSGTTTLLADVEQVLADVEWVRDTSGYYRFCPRCLNDSAHGHHESCALDALLQRVRAQNAAPLAPEARR